MIIECGNVKIDTEKDHNAHKETINSVTTMNCDNMIKLCCYGEEDCYPEDGDYEMMCDEHKSDWSANRADLLNDLD